MNQHRSLGHLIGRVVAYVDSRVPARHQQIAMSTGLYMSLSSMMAVIVLCLLSPRHLHGYGVTSTQSANGIRAIPTRKSASGDNLCSAGVATVVENDAQEACCVLNGSAHLNENGLVFITVTQSFIDSHSSVARAQLIHEKKVFANNVSFASSEENCTLFFPQETNSASVSCPRCGVSTCACANFFILVGRESGPCSSFFSIVKFPLASECK